MSTLRLTTISNQTGSSSVPSETVINGSAKAWVNFNGTGTVAIRASFNVSSITDNGTGQYTVNFTTAFADANYAANVSFGADSGSTGTGSWATRINAQNVGSIQVYGARPDGSFSDASIANVVVFR